MKYRLVPEDKLFKLLRDSHELSCLNWDGVDDWEWYLHSFDEYIATHLKETKQYKDRPIKELIDITIDECFDLNTLAEIDIEKYAEYTAPDNKDWSGFKESMSEQPAHEYDDDGWGGFPETSNHQTNSDPDGWDGLQGGM